MWVPTIYDTSFDVHSNGHGRNPHLTFVATEDSTSMLPQLVRYLQELD